MIELNKIHNIDCLEFMKTLPDKCIDLVLTDPPYGVDLEYDDYEDSFESWKVLISEFIKEAQRISRGAVIIPTSKLEGEVFIYRNFDPTWRICWYKGASSARCAIGFKDWETNFIFGKPIKQVHDHFLVQAHMVRKQVPDHPCPKPIEWATWFLERFSKEGDIVFDGFIGSGTTAVACKMLSRNYIGCEISPEYCKIAEQRIKSISNPLF